MPTICSAIRKAMRVGVRTVGTSTNCFRHLRNEVHRALRDNFLCDLGYFDDLHRNMRVQIFEETHQLFHLLRHRSVEDLHVRRVLDPLLHGVPPNPSLQLRLPHWLRHAHAANEKELRAGPRPGWHLSPQGVVLLHLLLRQDSTVRGVVELSQPGTHFETQRTRDDPLNPQLPAQCSTTLGSTRHNQSRKRTHRTYHLTKVRFVSSMSQPIREVDSQARTATHGTRTNSRHWPGAANDPILACAHRCPNRNDRDIVTSGKPLSPTIILGQTSNLYAFSFAKWLRISSALDGEARM